MQAEGFEQFGDLSPRDVEIMRVATELLLRGAAGLLREQAAEPGIDDAAASDQLGQVARAFDQTAAEASTTEGFFIMIARTTP